ncbi:MAG: aspartate kinase [Treponema sp.]|jgi:aspartate kinase|nr:aspartate kinase [Treponema sp.]
MIVMKFGGSSIANADRIRGMAEIVKKYIPRGPVLVLSAMGDTTDRLLEAAGAAINTGSCSIDEIRELHLKTIAALGLDVRAENEINPLLEELKNLLIGISMIKELTKKTKDYLVSFGERLSARIAAAYFRTMGVNAKALDSWDAGFLSDDNYSTAWILKESWEIIPRTLNPLVEAGVLPVVTGFIAKTTRNAITTLGRGGSDLTATVIAAACRAEEAQVWKDVDGILTADPRIVPDAKPLEAVTYEEAAELAYYGAQVLHPRSMQPCVKTSTPVLVKNSYNARSPGTRIVASLEKPAPVRAITTRKNVTLVDIVSTRMVGQVGFLERVFSTFAKHGVSIDMVATSEVSISVTVDAAYDLSGLQEDMLKIAQVHIKTGRAIVTIIGDVERSSEILSRMFSVCAAAGIQAQMLSQGASKVNISFIVNDDQSAEAVRRVHKEFFGKPASGKRGRA